MKYLLESYGIIVDYADNTDELKKKMEECREDQHNVDVIWVNFTSPVDSNVVNEMRKTHGYKKYIIGINSDTSDNENLYGFDAIIHLPVKVEDLYDFLQKYELVNS